MGRNSTDVPPPVESRNGVIRMQPVIMRVGTDYAVEHYGRKYHMRMNGDGSIDLFEEV